MATRTSKAKTKEVEKGIEAAAEGGKKYTAGFLDKPVDKQTTVERLRGGGWLSAAPTYQGDSKLLQARNLLHRALPGEKGMTVAMGGGGAVGELASSETAEGRKKGLGERVGRATGHLGGFIGPNPIFRRHGMIPGMVGSLVGAEVGMRGGGLAGRAMDTGVGALTGVNAGGGQVPSPQG